MMISKDRAYVWIWLPQHSQPVVCGVVNDRGGWYSFNYGRSYLNRVDAVALFGMPLQSGQVPLPDGMSLHGALRDALPDAWGQHVIMQNLTGRSGLAADTADLTPLTYMLASGSNRFGAIDFQYSATEYVPRQDSASLAELVNAADVLENGRFLPNELNIAFQHGTSIGGARPKVTIEDGNEHWIAKLSASTDLRPVVKQEALGLYLAQLSGVNAVDWQLTKANGRDVLLVRRFDRADNQRIMTVSGLTVLELDEMLGRYATYPDLLDKLRQLGKDSDQTGVELFRRIAVNIALGNTDDHARNHAMLWDGEQLRLSPAYDIDPCRTPGWDAAQAMAYGRNGERSSVLAELISCASVYGITRNQASEIVVGVIETINENYEDGCDLVQLSKVEQKMLWQQVILNPGC
ncbi:MAG: phosphatidylinositol kinase, partial [Actinomycetales bacterium]